MGKKPEKLKIPKTFGGCADMLQALQEKRLKLQREADAIEAQEKQLKKYIIDTMPKSDGGAQGKKARIAIENKTVPRVSSENAEAGTKDGWPLFRKWLVKNDRWDCLQKRLNEKAISDTWEAGKAIPGIEKFDVPVVRLYQVK